MRGYKEEVEMPKRRGSESLVAACPSPKQFSCSLPAARSQPGGRINFNSCWSRRLDLVI